MSARPQDAGGSGRDASPDHAGDPSAAVATILLVCTGNTCRSPMAAALLRHALCARFERIRSFGCHDCDLPSVVDVRSGGLAVAVPGEPASPNAVAALAELGLSLAGHAAQSLDAAAVEAADLILTMTRAHSAELLARHPQAAGRTYTLTEYCRDPDQPQPDIADPIGGSLATYRACAAQLKKELSRLVELIAGEEVVTVPHTETPSGPAPFLMDLPLAAAQAAVMEVTLVRLAVGADHAGYLLKDELAGFAADLGCEIIDLGTNGPESVDYPDFAERVAAAVAAGEADAGLLVCGTGLGMAIAANKVPGIRAVTVTDPFSARMSREHNDANVLALGARVTGPGLAKEILRVFLTTPFGGERHARRVRKIADLERNRKDR